MLLDGGEGASVADFIRAMKNAGRLTRQDIVKIDEVLAKLR